MEFFNLNNIMMTIWGYPLSHLEFWGTLTGLIAVWLAAKSKIWTWPIGLINVTLFFVIFYQIQLYSDMILQVYYFCTGILGWYVWSTGGNRDDIKIRKLSNKSRWILGISSIIGTIIIGYFVQNIHIYLPNLFSKPASYPYIDTFVAILSVYGNLQLAKAIWENWILWVIVNIISTWMYFQKGVIFISIEYFLFLCIAIYGVYSWTKKYNEQNNADIF